MKNLKNLVVSYHIVLFLQSLNTRGHETFYFNMLKILLQELCNMNLFLESVRDDELISVRASGKSIHYLVTESLTFKKN